MDRIEKMTCLNYASGHDEVRDLFVTLELSDNLFLEEEEKLIDELMTKFYKDYNEEIKQIIDKKFNEMKKC